MIFRSTPAAVFFPMPLFQSNPSTFLTANSHNSSHKQYFARFCFHSFCLSFAVKQQSLCYNSHRTQICTPLKSLQSPVPQYLTWLHTCDTRPVLAFQKRFQWTNIPTTLSRSSNISHETRSLSYPISTVNANTT